MLASVSDLRLGRRASAAIQGADNAVVLWSFLIVRFSKQTVAGSCIAPHGFLF